MRSGSITQAARLLHSSQPAVSHQLAVPDREAQTVLLRREPRGVKLTPAGRAAVADARRAIEAATIEVFLGLVDADEVDMALVPLPVPDRFTTTFVADEEIVLAAPSGHPLARRSTVRMQDLQDVQIVHFAPDNGLSGWLDRSLTTAGVHTEIVMRTAVSAAAPQLAAVGLGVAICP
jgi:DNA-binding transcriptional LysR family regulator